MKDFTAQEYLYIADRIEKRPDVIIAEGWNTCALGIVAKRRLGIAEDSSLERGPWTLLAAGLVNKLYKELKEKGITAHEYPYPWYTNEQKQAIVAPTILYLRRKAAMMEEGLKNPSPLLKPVREFAQMLTLVFMGA